MNRHWGEMSAVQSVHFDRATHTLRVAFQSGAVYDFADVPEHLYDELARAPQPDRYFHENVRDEFIATRAGDIDLAQLADERREDAIFGAPLAEQTAAPGEEDRPDAERSELASDARGSHHRWVVDMIDEDSAAVHIDGRQITPLPRWLLPADVREGDVLRVRHARSGSRSTLSIDVDAEATRLAFERSAEQMRGAPAGGTGDVTL